MTEARVAKLPPCDFHDDCVATVDFKTRFGPWANGCNAAWREYRTWATLGTGKGQKLVVRG